MHSKFQVFNSLPDISNDRPLVADCFFNQRAVRSRLKETSLHGGSARFLDCERSLLSAGLDFRGACERKGGTADSTSRNESALPTQRKIPIGRNRYACQSNLICSNYAINNFQSEC
jgi:hypothetical protein